jgi:hypothetical protein
MFKTFTLIVFRGLIGAPLILEPMPTSFSNSNACLKREKKAHPPYNGQAPLLQLTLTLQKPEGFRGKA